MVLKKINSSGVVEVVIAVTIIAICIGVASIVFVRSNSTMTDFEALKLETEAQNMLWGKLHELELDPFELEVIEELLADSLILFEIKRGSETIYEQEIYSNEQ